MSGEKNTNYLAKCKRISNFSCDTLNPFTLDKVRRLSQESHVTSTWPWQYAIKWHTLSRMRYICKMQWKVHGAFLICSSAMTWSFSFIEKLLYCLYWFLSHAIGLLGLDVTCLKPPFLEKWRNPSQQNWAPYCCFWDAVASKWGLSPRIY